MTRNVAVLGSINMDMIFHCGSFPAPGETRLAQSVSQMAGGKGLNQAVAAARAGASTSLSGAVGADPHGDQLIALLQKEGISTSRIHRSEKDQTGLAHIVVDDQAENMIVVASGANRADGVLQSDFVEESDHVALAQLETPVRTVHSFFCDAQKKRKQTILNAAPAKEEAAELLFPISDIIVVNEHELAVFSHCSVTPEDRDSIVKAAQKLCRRDGQNVIVTLGADGIVLVRDGAAKHIPAPRVTAIDTTGAGDCFCGYVAAGLATGLSLEDATARAARASAIAVTRHGASASIPMLAETEGAEFPR